MIFQQFLRSSNFQRLPGPDIRGICNMVLLLDLVQALNELRLLLLVTGRCYLVLELFELPLVVDDLGRITKIVVAMPTVAVFAHFTAD